MLSNDDLRLSFILVSILLRNEKAITFYQVLRHPCQIKSHPESLDPGKYKGPFNFSQILLLILFRNGASTFKYAF